MATLTRKDRLRRVVLVCCSFARNLAFYRAGQNEHGKRLATIHPNASFWSQVNSNFLDICVLDWCKLLGDRKEEHYWARVVSDKAKFEADLLAHLGIDASEFDRTIKEMRVYRDKFVAHLDTEAEMHPPKLDIPKSSVWFYHRAVVEEAKVGDLPLPRFADTAKKLDLGYQRCIHEATELYRTVT